MKNPLEQEVSELQTKTTNVHISLKAIVIAFSYFMHHSFYVFV